MLWRGREHRGNFAPEAIPSVPACCLPNLEVEPEEAVSGKAAEDKDEAKQNQNTPTDEIVPAGMENRQVYWNGSSDGTNERDGGIWEHVRPMGAGTEAQVEVWNSNTNFTPIHTNFTPIHPALCANACDYQCCHGTDALGCG